MSSKIHDEVLRVLVTGAPGFPKDGLTYRLSDKAPGGPCEFTVCDLASDLLACREALRGILDHYVSLALGGDVGFWDPEKEDEVIAARDCLPEQGHE